MRLLCLLLWLPLLAFADSDLGLPNWHFSIETTGTIGPKQKFDSLGKVMIPSADIVLEPYGGYAFLWRKYQENSHTVSAGIWDEAQGFQQYLKDNKGVEVPREVLAMKLGMETIFSSTSDQQITAVYRDLGRNLSFEQKIAFSSQLGGILSQGYDFSRVENNEGVVSILDMINARKNGGKAGVCRDMSFAVAQALKEMGATQTFIVSFQTVGGGHTTIIAQDPNNSRKTYTLNYDAVTTSEGVSPLSHLRQDSGINPGLGIDYRIYSADGKHLTALPTHLGVMFEEMVGGDLRNLDPMARSENQLLTAALENRSGFNAGASTGYTPDGDLVVAAHSSYTIDSKILPGSYAIVLYNARGETQDWGSREQTGAYFSAHQKIYSPALKVNVPGGQVRMRVLGKADFTSFYGRGNVENLAQGFWGLRFNTNYGAGGEAVYEATGGGTRIEGLLTATGGLGKEDIRDEQSYGADFQDVTAVVTVNQEIAQGIEGFVRATFVQRREELGAQSRQEAGINFDLRNVRGSVIAGHEGQVQGPELAFLPGSTEKYFVEASYRTSRGTRLSGGVFCGTRSTKECGLRVSATFILPLGWERRVFSGR